MGQIGFSRREWKILHLALVSAIGDWRSPYQRLASTHAGLHGLARKAIYNETVQLGRFRRFPNRERKRCSPAELSGVVGQETDCAVEARL